MGAILLFQIDLSAIMSQLFSGTLFPFLVAAPLKMVFPEKGWGYAGFCLWFHSPRCHFGTCFEPQRCGFNESWRLVCLGPAFFGCLAYLTVIAHLSGTGAVCI